MTRVRVMPTLLLSRRGAVKTLRFRDPTYVGDPLNIVRIWNSKEVDELILADIDASKNGAVPDLDLVEQIASEAFMPIAYGGAVRTIAEAKRLLFIGVEKISLNTATFEQLSLVSRLNDTLGAQCVVASIDVIRTRRGYEVYSHAGRRIHEKNPLRWAETLVGAGAGELLVNAVDRDGTKKGYDLELLRMFDGKFDIPIIASGGAASVADIAQAVHETKIRAFAAGALFIYEGPHRAVLPTYLSSGDLARIASAQS